VTNPPSIAVATVFLPRMELDYLADWIGYHRNLGVEHFYLYDNRHLSYDAKFNQRPAEKIWQKKPEADYHLDLSDDDIDHQVRQILAEAGPNVFHTAWPGGRQGQGGFYAAQIKAVNSLLKQLQEAQLVEWLAFIDVDELLVPSEDPLPSILNGLENNVAALELSQKLFESRWQNGRGVPFAQLSRSFGVLDFNQKLIARVSHCERWVNPHSLQAKQGRILKIPANHLRFHHFRGNEHFGKPAPPGWGVQQYVKLDAATEIDSSHCRHLPSSGDGDVPVIHDSM